METWRLEPEPGSTGTAELGSVGRQSSVNNTHRRRQEGYHWFSCLTHTNLCFSSISSHLSFTWQSGSVASKSCTRAIAKHFVFIFLIYPSIRSIPVGTSLITAGSNANSSSSQVPSSGSGHVRCCQMWGRRRPNEWLSQLHHSGDGTGRCLVPAPWRKHQSRTHLHPPHRGRKAQVLFTRHSNLLKLGLQMSFMSLKRERLTFWGCWGPWCLHTCGKGSSCREGCRRWSTDLVWGSCRRTCDHCVWTHRPRCRSRTPTPAREHGVTCSSD